MLVWFKSHQHWFNVVTLDENWFNFITKVVRSLEFCEVCLWFKTIQNTILRWTSGDCDICEHGICYLDYINLWIIIIGDDYLSFGGESVKVPPLQVLYVLYVKLYCPFPCLSSSQWELPVYFYLKEFLSHYKFTPFACFLVKYQSMSVICIGLFSRPVVCGWCSYPVITAIGLDPGCPGGPLSAPDPGGPLAPFLSCLALCLVI